MAAFLMFYPLFLAQTLLIGFYLHKKRDSPYWKTSAFVSALVLVGIAIGVFFLLIHVWEVPGTAWAAGLLLLAMAVVGALLAGFFIMPMVVRLMPKFLSAIPSYKDYT